MNIFTGNNNKVQYNNRDTINDGNHFDNFVLKKTDGCQSNGNLNQLLNKVKELSPEARGATHSLNFLQQNSDNITSSEQDYPTESTDKNDIRSMCITMLTFPMLNKFLHEDEDEDNTFL